jgi:hypothetical protein
MKHFLTRVFLIYIRNLLFICPVTTDSKEETDNYKSVTRQHSIIPKNHGNLSPLTSSLSGKSVRGQKFFLNKFT